MASGGQKRYPPEGSPYELKEFVTQGDGSNGPGYYPYLEGGRQY